MDILKKIVHVLSYVCYGIIGIYALICAPMVLGSRPVVVLTGSMRPVYNEGTIIYYKPVAQEEIAVGDIVTYQLNEVLVTHRVKRIENGNYITQGDSNNTEDSKPVPYSAVQGKVGGFALPVLGFGVQFINEHMWMFAIFVAILVAEFLLSNIKSGKISASKKGHQDEKEK